MQATIVVGALAALAIHVPAAGAAVVLNEINCEATDWVELVNTSATPADISGWLLTDDPLDANPPRPTHQMFFPNPTVIPAGGDMVVEKVTPGGFPFGLMALHVAEDQRELAEAVHHGQRERVDGRHCCVVFHAG